MDAPQAVPKTLEFKLPPTERADEQSDNSGSDVSWDEVSVIDGKTWWEAASDEVSKRSDCLTFCSEREKDSNRSHRDEQSNVDSRLAMVGSDHAYNTAAVGIYQELPPVDYTRDVLRRLTQPWNFIGRPIFPGLQNLTNVANAFLLGCSC